MPKENCDKCHFERARLEKYGDADLMHRTHITVSKIECDECHREISHKIVRDIESDRGLPDLSPAGPTMPRRSSTRGRDGKGVPHDSPNIMWEHGLSCQGCHILHEGGAVPLGRRDLHGRSRGV